jgi:hypothetical protein
VLNTATTSNGGWLAGGEVVAEPPPVVVLVAAFLELLQATIRSVMASETARAFRDMLPP